MPSNQLFTHPTSSLSVRRWRQESHKSRYNQVFGSHFRLKCWGLINSFNSQHRFNVNIIYGNHRGRLWHAPPTQIFPVHSAFAGSISDCQQDKTVKESLIGTPLLALIGCVSIQLCAGVIWSASTGLANYRTAVLIPVLFSISVHIYL